MAREPIPGLASRTFRVDLETYNEILDFFSSSSSGVSGSDAIRELLTVYGKYCRDQRRKGVRASGKHLAIAEDMVNAIQNRNS